LLTQKFWSRIKRKLEAKGIG